MTALDHADGEQRPVGPREALDAPGRLLVAVGGPQVFPAGDGGSAGGAFGQLGTFRRAVPRDVSDVRPDGDVVGAEGLHGVTDVVEEGGDVSRTAEEAG